MPVGEDEKTERMCQTLDRALELQQLLHGNVSKECEVYPDPATGMLVAIVPKDVSGAKSLLDKYVGRIRPGTQSLGPLCKGGTLRFYMPYC